MAESVSSRTALGVALLRAAHQVIDAEPKILDDPISIAMLGAGTVDEMRSAPARFQHPWARAIRSQVVTRSRYAEDRLAEAVQRGVSQFVLLGAGYDSFAYRQPDWAAGLRIFEVDQPATQADKIARLRNAGIVAPANVTFVSVDFERESLAEGLERSGFDRSGAAFFSVLGVLMYLTEDAVERLFGFIASLPRGSEIVFTFAGREGDDSPGRTLAASLAGAVGEPWLSRFDADALVAKLQAAGFTDIHLLDRDELLARYFADRTDGLQPPRGRRIGSAKTTPRSDIVDAQ